MPYACGAPCSKARKLQAAHQCQQPACFPQYFASARSQRGINRIRASVPLKATLADSKPRVVARLHHAMHRYFVSHAAAQMARIPHQCRRPAKLGPHNAGAHASPRIKRTWRAASQYLAIGRSGRSHVGALIRTDSTCQPSKASSKTTADNRQLPVSTSKSGCVSRAPRANIVSNRAASVPGFGMTGAASNSAGSKDLCSPASCEKIATLFDAGAVSWLGARSLIFLLRQGAESRQSATRAGH